MISEKANKIFVEAIEIYHKQDEIDQPFTNPYPKHTIDHLLYLKCWIDTMQWHMEDLVRDPKINAEKGLYWKRRIDTSNQERTDTVEYIDAFYLNEFKYTQAKPGARVNTESLAWALDRLSILALKIYHMELETQRKDASEKHRKDCQQKLNILQEQRRDLSTSIDELIADILAGEKRIKVYKQMKMYNDPDLNPVLYDAK